MASLFDLLRADMPWQSLMIYGFGILSGVFVYFLVDLAISFERRRKRYVRGI